MWILALPLGSPAIPLQPAAAPLSFLVCCCGPRLTPLYFLALALLAHLFLQPSGCVLQPSGSALHAACANIAAQATDL